MEGQNLKNLFLSFLISSGSKYTLKVIICKHFLLPSSEIFTLETCCKSKEVGGKIYHLVEDNDMAVPSNCSENCVYTMAGDIHGNKYCFAPGHFTPHCKGKFYF